VRGPKVFLSDEPLSNLDALLRVQICLELVKLHHQVHTTKIYVTHDQVGAMTLADKIVVMDKGEVAQVSDLVVQVADASSVKVGDTVAIGADPQHLHLF